MFRSPHHKNWVSGEEKDARQTSAYIDLWRKEARSVSSGVGSGDETQQRCNQRWNLIRTVGAWTHSLPVEFFPPLLHHITPTQAEDRGLCFDNSFFWQPGQIDSEPDTFVSQAANQKTIFSRLISSISLSPTPQQQKPCRSLARAKTGAGMCKWWNYSGSVSCRGVKEISRLFYTFWHLLLLKLKLEIGMLVGKIKHCGGGFKNH